MSLGRKHTVSGPRHAAPERTVTAAERADHDARMARAVGAPPAAEAAAMPAGARELLAAIHGALAPPQSQMAAMRVHNALGTLLELGGEGRVDLAAAFIRGMDDPYTGGRR